MFLYYEEGDSRSYVAAEAATRPFSYDKTWPMPRASLHYCGPGSRVGG